MACSTVSALAPWVPMGDGDGFVGGFWMKVWALVGMVAENRRVWRWVGRLGRFRGFG